MVRHSSLSYLTMVSFIIHNIHGTNIEIAEASLRKGSAVVV